MQALGLGILVGACITKLPQIIGVYKSKSGEGLPLLSSELENYVYLIHVSYGVIMGLQITSFGEAAVTWLQNIVLLMMLYRFKQASPLRPMLTVAVVAMVMGPVSQNMIDQSMIAKLYDLNSTVYMASKLPQIIAAFQQVCIVLLQSLLPLRLSCIPNRCVTALFRGLPPRICSISL